MENSTNKSKRQIQYEKYGPKAVSMNSVRKGQGEWVRTVINLETKQREEHYRINSSGTIVKVCRKATDTELREELAAQNELAFNRIRTKYLAKLTEKETQGKTLDDDSPVL